MNLHLGDDPFNWIGTKGLFGLPRWVDITFGVLFIILGLSILLVYYPRTKRNAKEYRKLQLKEWKKQNPKRTLATYKDTKMFLPPWEKAKQMMPIILCLTFCILGIAWIAGNTLTSL